MSHVEWNPDLELGVEKIDNQHKYLIGLANKLMDAAKHGAAKEITEAFHAFREYTVSHFADEEEYMQRIRYPRLQEHALQHVDLKKRVKAFQDALYKHDTITEDEILEFLRKWLIEHIVYNDLAIKKHLAAHPGDAAGEGQPKKQPHS